LGFDGCVYKPRKNQKLTTKNFGKSFMAFFDVIFPGRNLKKKKQASLKIHFSPWYVGGLAGLFCTLGIFSVFLVGDFL